MKGSVLTASALVGGGLLAHVVLDDPGYVAISAGSSLLETTVPVLLLLLVGLYFVARAIIESLTARRRLATLRVERRKRRARNDTQRGLLDLAAGRWRSAEDLLTRRSWKPTRLPRTIWSRPVPPTCRTPSSVATNGSRGRRKPRQPNGRRRSSRSLKCRCDADRTLPHCRLSNSWMRRAT